MLLQFSSQRRRQLHSQRFEQDLGSNLGVAMGEPQALVHDPLVGGVVIDDVEGLPVAGHDILAVQQGHGLHGGQGRGGRQHLPRFANFQLDLGMAGEACLTIGGAPLRSGVRRGNDLLHGAFGSIEGAVPGGGLGVGQLQLGDQGLFVKGGLDGLLQGEQYAGLIHQAHPQLGRMDVHIHQGGLQGQIQNRHWEMARG